MNAAKLEVQWSPHDSNRFITFGSDLSTYQVEEIKPGLEKLCTPKISETRYVSLLHTNSSYQYLKCVAWYPKIDFKNLLAVGLANGKVVLTSFGNEADPNGWLGREFVPRNARQCNSLCWNPEECNLLAAGLDRVKVDHSILIWDVHKGSGPTELDRRTLSNNSDANQMINKPLVELGHSELTHSLRWFRHQPKTFVAGLSNKHLKIFDLRDATKHHNVTTTKAVFGVSIDPFSEHRLASFSENQVVIWDVRNFEKPVLSINEARPTTHLAWCPTRNNLLASTSKETGIVKLYDVQLVPLSADELEPLVFERVMQPCDRQSISSFSWHPIDENRMLLLTSDAVLKDFVVFERIIVSWNPPSTLAWNSGRKTICYVAGDGFLECLHDVSIQMKQRALTGSGLKLPSTAGNSSFFPRDDKIDRLWSWIDMVNTCYEDGALKSTSKNFLKFRGVRDIICSARLPAGGATNMKSEAIVRPWMGLAASHNAATGRIYMSDDREKALQLCGWGYDKDGIALSKLLERLEMSEMFERAAAISIFHLKMRRAIDSLRKGALLHHPEGNNPNLNIVAMALSGYTSDKSGLWREMCTTLRLQLRNPYLRALFSFLTCDDDSYGDVLNEAGLAVQDRVAFACLFLCDNKLADFLNRLSVKMIENGNLDGILLTGLTLEGLDLLQQYLDLTGDVQTPCIVIMQAQCPALRNDSRVQQWIESYRNLLDQWRLWHQRAEFDVEWNRLDGESQPPQHVFISCNFCGKSISSYMLMQNISGSKSRPSIYGNKTKMTSCPGCRKPLPRCALCLVNMGTAAGTGLRRQIEEKTDDNRISKFASWFTWCQTCRHGGHAGHILEWFKDHIECPVTSCPCKCMSLDSVSRVDSFHPSVVKT